MPDYLKLRNSQLESDYNGYMGSIRTIEEHGNDDMVAMPQEDLADLRHSLHDKYVNLTNLYQSKSHQNNYNSEWEKKRKEALEREIAHVET